MIEFDDCKAVHATDKALKIRIPEIDREPQWVPRWAIEPESEVQENRDEGTLVLAKKFCEDEGWV